MTERVKRNPLAGGQARTRLARRAVIDAARNLFIEGGYATTTMSMISRRADVPEPTVYRLFSSKLGILKSLLDVSIAGDDEPAAVVERAGVASILDETDPSKMLAGFAAVTTQINQRTSAVYGVLSRAADSDLEAAVLFRTLCEQRDRGQEQFVRALHHTQKLRSELTAACDAADIVHELMSPEVYRLLVGDRGWHTDRYQQWLANTLVQLLT